MRFIGRNHVFARVERLQARLDDPTPPMQEAAALLRKSIDANFDAQGRPTRWTGLSASTLAARRRRGNTGTKILEDTGAMRSGVQTIMQGNSFEIGSNAVQARRMHHGWPGHTTARPWVMFQTEDIETTGNIFSRYYRS